jgi:hypothetical protein
MKEMIVTSEGYRPSKGLLRDPFDRWFVASDEGEVEVLRSLRATLLPFDGDVSLYTSSKGR